MPYMDGMGLENASHGPCEPQKKSPSTTFHYNWVGSHPLYTLTNQVSFSLLMCGTLGFISSKSVLLFVYKARSVFFHRASSMLANFAISL